MVKFHNNRYIYKALLLALSGMETEHLARKLLNIIIELFFADMRWTYIVWVAAYMKVYGVVWVSIFRPLKIL